MESPNICLLSAGLKDPVLDTRAPHCAAELTHKLGEEDYKERRDEVIDALDVATSWMPDCPDKQNPFKHLGGSILKT